MSWFGQSLSGFQWIARCASPGSIFLFTSPVTLMICFEPIDTPFVVKSTVTTAGSSDNLYFTVTLRVPDWGTSSTSVTLGAAKISPLARAMADIKPQFAKNFIIFLL
jgi:hypothetical protein